MSFKIIVSIGLFSGLLSCLKETDKSITSGLVGTWQWVSSDGGFAFHIHETPASTGKNIDLKLASDYRYYIYTNSILTSQGTYQLQTKTCIHNHSNKTFIDFSSGNDQDLMVEKVDHDVLELSDENFDGVGSKFVRKKL